MKVVQIIPNGNGVMALTEDGKIYCGFFLEKGPFKKPEFGWRKLPTIIENAYTFRPVKEPTEKELAAAEKTSKALAEKAAADYAKQIKKERGFEIKPPAPVAEGDC